MTTPVTHGYPDYGRFQAQADVLFVHDESVQISNPVTYGPFFVGSVPAVGLDIAAGPGAADVSLSWWADEAMTLNLTGETLSFQNGTYTVLTIPVMGPWLSIEVVDVVSPVTYTLKAWSSPTRRGWATLGTGSQLIGVINTAIAAGATATSNASEVYLGRAYWSGWQGVVNFVAFLEAVDAAGTVTILDRWQGGTADFWRPVYLPGVRCRIRHVNQSGGATVFSSVLLKDPLVVGH